MNWVDYTIIAVMALSVVISLFRGLLKEVMALVVWVAAFWVAFHFVDPGAAWFSPWISVPSAQMAAAFVVLFLVTLIVGGLISYLLGRLIETTGLSGTDRFFGIFFGLARALVLVTAVVLVAGLTPLPQDPWWRESVLLPRFEVLAQWASGYMPEQVRGYLEYPTALDLVDPLGPT